MLLASCSATERSPGYYELVAWIGHSVEDSFNELGKPHERSKGRMLEKKFQLGIRTRKALKAKGKLCLDRKRICTYETLVIEVKRRIQRTA